LLKPFIKICGITRLEDAEFAILSGADAVGFIAYPNSPRFITANAVKKICDKLNNDSIKKVGVFVDADLQTIEEYCIAGINTIQLHGHEDADFTKKCQKTAEVWKVLKPESNTSILKYRRYPVQAFLLDAVHRKLPGGTGLTVDRKLAKFAISNLSAPVILAGGINPANFAEILNDVKPYGMDINSGVEKEPGIKDHQKIKEIFDTIKNRILN